jgi:phosphoserine phosphatase RsbX
MEKESHESTENLLIEWAVAERSLAGHAESGDGYVVQSFPHGMLIAVIDGLGHGDRAASVSQTAIATLQAYAHEPISALIKRCHESLRGSRGAVMSLASFNLLKSAITWLGVGNVDGILLHGDSRENPIYKSLVLRGGVVGYRLPSLYETSLPVAPGDILIFVTDGIRSGFVKEQTQFYSVKQTPPVDRTQSARQIADYILAHYGRSTDDALVLVARYRGSE